MAQLAVLGGDPVIPAGYVARSTWPITTEETSKRWCRASGRDF